MNNTELFEGLSPEEYAAQWGCDPMYDYSPRLPGDGYLFYNFGSECQKRDEEYLTNFEQAIQRTMDGCTDPIDLENLEALFEHVASLVSAD